jgi:ATP-binding protein involved in chromosome partitioning
MRNRALKVSNNMNRKRAELESQRGQILRLGETMKWIRHKLLIVSGKGGVGKSTVAVNVAYCLAQSDRDVGLLDVDIHGPNVPKMLGLEGKRLYQRKGGKIQPVLKSPKLKVMSMGFLLETPDTAVVWRGPLKMKVIQQFLSDVDWGYLDYLVIDSPPGTGDEPLSACQLISDIDGAIVVTTPQEVALLDGKKCVSFAHQLKIPILGLIENMSGFTCPHCGREVNIFRKGGGEKAAAELGIPFLGRVPLDPLLVASGDRGVPFVKKYPSSETAKLLNLIVVKILSQIGEGNTAR